MDDELCELDVLVLDTSANFGTVGGFDPEYVRLWSAEFDQMMDALPILEAELPHEERMKSRRFHFDKDRRQFILARGLLRLILGHYLSREPSQIEFAYNAYGRPSLAGPSPLTFNLAHSGNRLLLGFAACKRIGVDIERVATDLDVASISRDNCTPREREILELYPDDAVRNFFTYWTCKEALLKGMGIGLTGGLKRLNMSCMAKEISASVRISMVESGEENWVITKLSHIPGYAGAVALEGGEGRLLYSEFTKETLGGLLQERSRVRHP